MHTTIFNDKIDFTAMICSFFRFFLKSKFSKYLETWMKSMNGQTIVDFLLVFFSYSMHMKSKYFHLFRHESWMTASKHMLARNNDVNDANDLPVVVRLSYCTLRWQHNRPWSFVQLPLNRVALFPC